MSTAKNLRLADPIICWPRVTDSRLSNAIADMRRLNPDLGLRCAVSTWRPDYGDFARARAIVAARSEFAIVGDAENGEALVFRMSGVESFIADFRLPEWPWFTLPLRVGE